jgi:hypothetical protein
MKHCLNKWKGRTVCDTCQRNLLHSELIGRGEIEGTERLQEQLDLALKEKDQWHQHNRQVDAEIYDKTQVISGVKAKQRLEIQKLKEQLLVENARNESMIGIVVKLTEALDGSKQCESLTASRTRDYEVQLEANRSELYINADQVRLLSERLSAMSRNFDGMVTCRQVLSTVCRSCKVKVNQRYRRQVLEANMSEAFTTLTRTRTEMNRRTVREADKEHCKCVLM